MLDSNECLENVHYFPDEKRNVFQEQCNGNNVQRQRPYNVVGNGGHSLMKDAIGIQPTHFDDHQNLYQPTSMTAMNKKNVHFSENLMNVKPI